MWKTQLFELNFDEKEVEAVASTVRSGWLTMGERTENFENEFSAFLGGNVECTAVSSCTAALHMALLALGVHEGDEVVIPALTFVADANVCRLVGAIPRVADSVSLDDWNMSLASVRQSVTSKTKAVIVVHFAGYPCNDIEAIAAFCQERGIGLIEDVAHAPGAEIYGRSCGVFGDISCFSFFSNKNLSVGEGGMLAARSEALNQRLRNLRSHGMTTLTLDRHKGRARTYDVTEPGLNYRMDEMRSAIGSVRLKKLRQGNSS